MSVRVMTAVWALDLPAGEKLVLLALADCANDDGACWPGMKNLMGKTGKGERSLQAAIKSLVDANLLGRAEVPGRGCNYTVLPRNNCAPADSAPPQKKTKTPAKIAGKPSGTVISGKAKAFPQRARNLSQWVPLPLGWTPTRPLSVNNQAKVEQWPPGAFDDELESFRAWAANAAPVVGKGLKKDWDDAFGNWIRAQHNRITRQQHRTNYGKNPTAIALSLLNT